MPEPYDLAAPLVVQLAAQGLGLSDAERRISSGSRYNAPTGDGFLVRLHARGLAKVRALLDRSGLSYADLRRCSHTVRQSGRGVTIAPPPGAEDACDTATLQANGLTDDVLSRLHVFVRLWRKLGWEIQLDVDRAVCTLAADPNAPV